MNVTKCELFELHSLLPVDTLAQLGIHIKTVSRFITFLGIKIVSLILFMA